MLNRSDDQLSLHSFNQNKAVSTEVDQVGTPTNVNINVANMDNFDREQTTAGDQLHLQSSKDIFARMSRMSPRSYNNSQLNIKLTHHSTKN